MINVERQSRRTFGSYLMDPGTRQTAYLFIVSLTFLILATAILFYGWDYYMLDLALRPFSSKHFQLRPSGTVGLRIGMTGFVMFVLVYLYPLRKHWTVLGRIGKTRNWFNFHVLLGLTAPIVITLHSAFKLHGFAGMAYWTMLALVGSGIIGRYFYAQIPRNISAAELSLKEMNELKNSLLEELSAQNAFKISDIETLFRLPDSRDVQSMPIIRALALMIWLDIARPFRVWALRRREAKKTGAFSAAGILRMKDVELEKAISLASKQAALSKRVLFLSKTQQVFHLWHVIHRPFSISFAGFVIIHVTVVTWLGYF
jgi:hypothetical protein